MDIYVGDKLIYVGDFFIIIAAGDWEKREMNKRKKKRKEKILGDHYKVPR